MQEQSINTTTRQALVILGAWRSGNQERLGKELDRVSRMKTAGSDSAETERMELLSAIVCELRAAALPYGAASSKLYCGLLEHLAFFHQSVQRANPFPATPALFQARSATVQ